MPAAYSILIIDDESSMRHLLRTILEENNYHVDEAENGRRGLKKVESNHYDLVLCDIRMPELNGIDFLIQALSQFPQLTVIMMSAYGSLETALNCMKKGAYDYISKPFRPDEIVLTLKKAQERLQLQQENSSLRLELRNITDKDLIIGESSAIHQVRQQITKLAAVSSPVLIHGETGTGKELVARSLHKQSPRHNKPFIAVNCSAISPHLVESELFGHRKGSFTGATECHNGLFCAADGGTLFLDEIAELPLDFQPKLLRALQEHEIRPIGSTTTKKVDVRIIAATAKNLKNCVKESIFREDLYYRLAVVELTVPTLRSRTEDIPLLCTHFLKKISSRDGRKVPQILPEAITALQNYSWPGNVRELQNILENIMIFCTRQTIEREDLPNELHAPSPSFLTPVDEPSLKKAIAQLERTYIEKALHENHGNRTLAAKQLEISLRSLHYKIKEYKL